MGNIKETYKIWKESGFKDMKACFERAALYIKNEKLAVNQGVNQSTVMTNRERLIRLSKKLSE